MFPLLLCAPTSIFGETIFADVPPQVVSRGVATAAPGLHSPAHVDPRLIDGRWPKAAKSGA
jgi:hypothetical protein